MLNQKGFSGILVFLGMIVLVSSFVGSAYYFKKSSTTISSLPSASPTNTLTEYKELEIRELIQKLEKYDTQKVLIKGKYKNTSMRPRPMCYPMKDPNSPVKILDIYSPYSSSWAISNRDGEIGIVVTDENMQISTLPNYSEDQEITLKGTVRFILKDDICSSENRKYKSIYLEVKSQNVNITHKVSPSNKPLSPKTLPR